MDMSRLSIHSGDDHVGKDGVPDRTGWVGLGYHVNPSLTDIGLCKAQQAASSD